VSLLLSLNHKSPQEYRPASKQARKEKVLMLDGINSSGG
jgi:hypothetical protein